MRMVSWDCEKRGGRATRYHSNYEARTIYQATAPPASWLVISDTKARDIQIWLKDNIAMPRRLTQYTRSC